MEPAKEVTYQRAGMLPKDSSRISTVIDNQAQWVKGDYQ